MLTAEHTKALKESQFSLQNKNVNEKLDVLCNILAEITLLAIVNGRRSLPVPTKNSTLGFKPAYVLRRIPVSLHHYALNTFQDDLTPFDHETHTQLIPIGADDLLCYNNDMLMLGKVIKAVFDKSLLMFAQDTMKKGDYVGAFTCLSQKYMGHNNRIAKQPEKI